MDGKHAQSMLSLFSIFLIKSEATNIHNHTRPSFLVLDLCDFQSFSPR
uniref:Uncharacterized protein n=1 Tax=Anguilla anguilla TaxID=7936 RepID=A0A0E9U202_ANGAN